jgi:hypothetical protein
MWQGGDVRVFYPEQLQVRPGTDRIRIRLRNLLLMQWLEIEGARSIVSAPSENHA